MKGKKAFTSAEIKKLEDLIKLRNKSVPSVQKGIRQKIRDIGFYGKDDWGITDLQLTDLHALIKSGQIKVIGSSFKPTMVSTKTIKNKTTPKPKTQTPVSTFSANIKQSFDPISDFETTVLILGTMPGDKSIELNEYYGHPRNRFWKIISSITDNAIPLTYSDKKLLLLKSKIGIWDVAHKARRKGSLDSAIEDALPNDLDNFISIHENLKVIGFNGTKSEALFDEYFSRDKGIRYISLPSTSPANTRISFENICKVWQQILE